MRPLGICLTVPHCFSLTVPHCRLFFADASEERLKILLLYLPATIMAFLTASVMTILFALLDGEMRIYVSSAGRFRLGILSYVVIMLTIGFSNKITPIMLEYLDLYVCPLFFLCASRTLRSALSSISHIHILTCLYAYNNTNRGQPTLMRGDCPNCTSPVSCLFTGAARTRDERKCSVCGAQVGFNQRWSKVYLVAPPGSRDYAKPD